MQDYDIEAAAWWHAAEKGVIMAGNSNAPERDRSLKEAELESRREQKNALEFELEEFRQTRQDTSAVSERLATVVAQIARLEVELGNP